MIPDKRVNITNVHLLSVIMMKHLLLQTWVLLLLSLGLGECADCDEATSGTIYSLLEVLESDPSVQQQVRHRSKQGATSIRVILVSALGPNTSFFLLYDLGVCMDRGLDLDLDQGLTIFIKSQHQPF